MAWRTLSILTNAMRMAGGTLAITSILCLSNLASAAQQDAGKTIMAKGDVMAHNDNAERQLVRRSPVYKADLVTTGDTSTSQLRMIDGALLSMQANSELRIADYEFSPQNQQGNVSMSLIKGGLRTVTGALQQNSDNYRLTTPVASIGVRGTHFEAEMVEADLYLAAWDGIIFIEVTVANSGEKFSLGPTLRYQFAIVRADGSVEFLLQTPGTFSAGHSSEIYAQPIQQFALVDVSEAENNIYIAQSVNQKYIDNERFAANWLPDDPLVVSRTGSVAFDLVEQHSVVSSSGSISDFTMSITVDFDASTVPTGNLSFVDSGGQWFAAFNGLLNQQGLDVDVNFASHGNNLASGSIEGLLIDQAQGILGNLNLAEINTPSITADGAFELRESKP